MSGTDIRKFMNVLNESFVNEAGGKTYNVQFTDYNDGYDFVLSFASQEDAEIYVAIEAGMDEGGVYASNGIQSTAFTDLVAEKIVPAGTLKSFEKAAYAEEFKESTYFRADKKLAKYKSELDEDGNIVPAKPKAKEQDPEMLLAMEFKKTAVAQLKPLLASAMKPVEEYAQKVINSKQWPAAPSNDSSQYYTERTRIHDEVKALAAKHQSAMAKILISSVKRTPFPKELKQYQLNIVNALSGNKSTQPHSYDVAMLQSETYALTNRLERANTGKNYDASIEFFVRYGISWWVGDQYDTTKNNEKNFSF